MTVNTRDFGTLELDEKEFITFVSPIFGFEELSRFALLSDDEAGPGLFWLQSVEKPEVCFILLEPAEVGLHDYRPELPAEIRELLDVKEEVVVQVIAVVPPEFANTTVNLKSPVVINPQNKRAAQAILEAEYPLRMRLFGEEETSC